MKATVLRQLGGSRLIGHPTMLQLRAVKRVTTAKAKGTARGGRAKEAAAPTACSGHGSHKLSLADFYPAIARTWIAAASNKMLQPQHVAPDSRKLAWWICPSCHHQHNKRIDLHLAAGGACPKCEAKPTMAGGASAKKSTSSSRGASNPASPLKKKQASAASAHEPVPAAAVLRHRCRPNSTLDTIAAGNANLLSKSVADNQYLRVQETRNLLPMLAKSYDKERWKIAPGEVLQVSPKLDGIRCVAAYRIDTKQVLFFSRSGTLFECCDDAIEPALRCLFEKDPSLVLDGELYNDSINLAQLSTICKTVRKATPPSPTAALSGADPVSAFYNALLVAAYGKKKHKGSSAPAAAGLQADAPAVIRFDQLTSAIRTTRQWRTPEVAALQRQLQYHVFDVLYSREFPYGRGSAVPFSVRYGVLERLLASATAYNLAHISKYNPLVLRRVPSYSCTIDAVDAVLQAAIQVGYEGIMIRRECRGATTAAGKDGSDTVESATKKIKRGAASSGSKASAMASTANIDAGYGYGQRSSTLLKYKVMQDAEYIIVGAVEGSGKWKGFLGSFICVTPDKKHRFTVTPASTDADKRRMWQSWKTVYKGKALTVQYQEITAEGVPRFPVGKCVRGAADGHDWL
ncbi:putative DNA ligase k alpha [Leishmania mexicana MHOM/GT/2001/U1103]|uniref:DNA ligase k alpha n=1 Tax=Leishmania mexicana (strain MHOM/GT/2001/U1103) TaxID=929439 RepID=E9AYB3_LEIMU|nr:putative DNA ligase k alpha [Leishmania mexicana MHOM/GT/2001/U1103]CBZ27954.1 putative DNA ligase k alpha [Leishmania mexicana MHOM/GT/2001/U1103]